MVLVNSDRLLSKCTRLHNYSLLESKGVGRCASMKKMIYRTKIEERSKPMRSGLELEVCWMQAQTGYERGRQNGER